MATAVERRVNKLLHESRHPDRGLAPDVARAIDHIELLMEGGLLNPGQRLIETELAERIGVGRGRIREALRVLAGQAVVELRTNKGARIRPLLDGELSSLVAVGSGLQRIGLELFLDRITLLSANALQEVAYVASRLPTGYPDPATFALRTVEFHTVVNHHTGNTYLNALQRSLASARLGSSLMRALGDQLFAETVEEYSRIADAVLAGRNAAVTAHRQMSDRIIAALRKTERL